MNQTVAIAPLEARLPFILCEGCRRVQLPELEHHTNTWIKPPIELLLSRRSVQVLTCEDCRKMRDVGSM